MGIKFTMVGNLSVAKDSDKHRAFEDKLTDKGGIFRSLISRGGWANCLYLSNSKWNTEILKKALWLPDKNFIESNYPRNTAVIKTLGRENEYIMLTKKYKYTILYLPTFRQDKHEMDVAKIINNLEKMGEDYLILYKLHPASNVVVCDKKINKLPDDFDINVLMPFIDVLLTDYSSCASDALYHNKKCVFYVPDLIEYTNGKNGFFDNPEKYMCGPIVNNIQDLNEIIVKCCNNESDVYFNKYKRIKELMWEHPIDVEEIWNDIYKKIEKKE